MNYLDELNESQRLPVQQIDGPLMVIAGAGSGKTRVLTYRIAFMIENGIDPFNIMALTFTNKAAKEMSERIASIVGDSEARSISMGTFHSVFSRILRYNSDRIGYPSNFTIYDTQDSKSLLKDIIKGLNLDDKAYKVNHVYGRISSAKNNLLSADAYAQNEEIVWEDKQAKRPELSRIYKAYENRCRKSGAMDFDDLLFQTHVLLSKFPDVLHYYQQKYRYLLVDEYQDTNYAQYLIIKKLAAAYENICVVGDDAQSIYSFRGANIKNILNFKVDYPDFNLYKLEQNYRSSKNIVEAANSIISKNKDQIHKVVWTDNTEGNKVSVTRALSDNEEGKIIAHKIYKSKENGVESFNDFAILYRTNRQSRSFEEALRKLNIPYRIYGGISFYQRKEIKDLLAYFRLTSNPNDEEAFKRVLNYPRRALGNTTKEKIIIAANQNGVSLWDIVSNPEDYPLALNKPTQGRVNDFVTMIQSFQAEQSKLNAFELGETIAKESGIIRELKGEIDKGPEEIERFQNIEELLGGLQEFVDLDDSGDFKSLSDFLLEVALLTDADTENKEDRNHVSLMTIHSSKGLEFPFVYVVGLEENLFPSQLSLHSRSDLEEERRLFYVAITRAKSACTLSYASSRFTWGQLISSEPSRFIDEINPNFLEFETPKLRGGGRSLKSRGSNPTFANKFQNKVSSNRNLKPLSSSTKPTAYSSKNEFMVGQNIIHERFGKGKITKLNGFEADQKAVIFFPTHGTKTVLLRFAKLTIVEEQ